MDISDSDLRALVRDAIARHTPSGAALASRPSVAGSHASHLRFSLVNGSDESGACLIEPGVDCTRCGYCQSYGH